MSLDALVVTHLPNVCYLTGFSGTAGAVVLTRSRCLLVVDFRYVSAARAIATAIPDLVSVELSERSYDETLMAMLRRDGSARVGIEAAWLPVNRFNALAAGLDGSSVLVATERLVERVRLVKDQAEIQTIREAARRLSSIAQRLPSFIAPGRRERDVAFAIDVAMHDAGFSRPAFDTIVASGPNSALPHARPTDRLLEVGEPTVLDFGGVYDGYCVDLTRTVQLGPAGADFRRLYDAVGWRRPRPSRRFDRAPVPARSMPLHATCLNGMGLGRRSATGPGTGWAWSARGAADRSAVYRACPTIRRRARRWSSRSNRAPTSPVSAACASKTTCW